MGIAVQRKTRVSLLEIFGPEKSDILEHIEIRGLGTHDIDAGIRHIRDQSQFFLMIQNRFPDMIVPAQVIESPVRILFDHVRQDEQDLLVRILVEKQA